jgi:3-oxoacyl-[acyl-carrier protein] reductase
VLEDKKIIVTGASRGIGRAIALACAREGAVVGINYRVSEKEAKQTQLELLERFNRSSTLLQFDVRDEEAVERAIEAFTKQEGRLDGLVNNAGTIVPGLLPTISVDDCRAQIDVNLLGSVICARSVLPIMLVQRSGVILNVGSVASSRPVRGQAVYAATKGAVEAFTRALAAEYARKGIRINCLQPGPIETSMIEGTRELAEPEILSRIPLKRFGKPEEVADLAVFLLGDTSGFVTGSTFTIDGGYLEG